MSVAIVFLEDGRAFVCEADTGAVIARLVRFDLAPSEDPASYHSPLNDLNAPSARIFNRHASDTRQDRTPAPPSVEGVMVAKNGEANGNSKLTPKRVQQIRDNVALGFSQRAVAAHFGLSQATVSDICAGRMWAHLPDEPASVLRRVDFALVDPVMRSNRGRFGGPTGVVELYPEHDDDAGNDDDGNDAASSEPSPPPPRAA
jgi:hypothetical protein